MDKVAGFNRKIIRIKLDRTDINQFRSDFSRLQTWSENLTFKFALIINRFDRAINISSEAKRKRIFQIWKRKRIFERFDFRSS